jgi:hypothetical protein
MRNLSKVAMTRRTEEKHALHISRWAGIVTAGRIADAKPRFEQIANQKSKKS